MVGTVAVAATVPTTVAVVKAERESVAVAANFIQRRFSFVNDCLTTNLLKQAIRKVLRK